jgi:hypothetical protein
MAVKKRKTQKKDPEKESVYKGLVSKLTDMGYTVRREKLKQGFGWKVVSGQCTFNTERLIFVDSRMSQDDQISFLTARLDTLPTLNDAIAASSEPQESIEPPVDQAV